MRATSAKLRSRTALVKRMQELDRSQASLARLVGCSKQYIQKLAAGTVETCSAETAFAIEGVLQVPTGSLFVRASEPVTRKKPNSRAEVAA